MLGEGLTSSALNMFNDQLDPKDSMLLLTV